MIRSNSYVRATAVALILAAGAAGAEAQSSEGIKVHGDWTIDVRQPDGTLVKSYVFKNSLTEHGKPILTRLLSRFVEPTGLNVTFGRWIVKLTDPTSDPCPADVESGCSILEGQGLTVTANGDLSAVVFTGDLKVAASGQISVVRTALEMLVNGHLADVPQFTGKLLPSPIPVTEGQIVQVKVVISFS